MKLSLSQKTLLISILAIVCLFILGFVSVQHRKAATMSRYWIKHTGEVLYKTEQTFSQLKDIESSVRGYVITGDSSFLETYKKALPVVWRYINNLDSFTVDNIPQQLRIDTLRDLVTERLHVSKSIIDTRGAGLVIISTAVKKGKLLMDKIRSLISRMDANENELMVKRKGINAANERETNAILYAFFTIVVIVFLLLLLSFWFTIKLNRQSLVQVKAKRNFFDNNGESVINSIEDPFFAIDSKGGFVFVNNAGSDKLGFKKFNISNTNIFETYSTYKTNTIGINMQQALQDGKPKYFEVYDDFLDQWQYVTIHPVDDGLIVHVQDGGRRKEEQLQLLKKLQFYKDNELAKIGSWEMDVEEGTVYWSEVATAIYETEPGYTPNLKDWMHFFKPGESKDAIVKAVTEAMETGTGWDKEFEMLTAKQHKKKVRVCGVAEMKAGSCTMIYGIIQEIV